MDARNYSEATRKALFTLSMGRCYEPDCDEKVVRMADDGTPIVLVQIAHIRAAKKGGPRYDTAMTDDQRRAFTNLLLLCTYHHKLVDNMPTGVRYSIDLLTGWKTAREGQMVDDLRMLTEDRLIEILGSTLGSIILDTKDELMGAIGEVDQVSRESAGLLRTLVTETFKRPHLDPAAITSLADSADAFRGVTEHAPMLHESSWALNHTLPDYAPMLARSSSELRELPDYVHILASATSVLTQLPSWLDTLDSATSKLSYLNDHGDRFVQSCLEVAQIPDHATAVHAAANAAFEAAGELRDALRQIEALREQGFVNELGATAAQVNETAQGIREAAETAAAMAVGHIPDRLTWVIRGIFVGLALAGIVALGIWYLASR